MDLFTILINSIVNFVMLLFPKESNLITKYMPFLILWIKSNLFSVLNLYPINNYKLSG